MKISKNRRRTLLVLLCIGLYSLGGCESARSKHNAVQEANDRETIMDDLRAIEGQRVTLIEGPAKPMTFGFEDGSRITIDAYKSDLTVDVKKP